MAIKIVFCPNCTRKIYLTWNNTTGVFRGSCPKCSCLIYARDTGRAWVNRGTQKWIAIVNDPEQYKLDVPLKIHLLITEMNKTDFIGLISGVWDDLKGLVT